MKKLYFLIFGTLISSFSFSQPVINEVDADTPSTDVAEFIEILWTPNTALDGYVVVLYNGTTDQSYAAYDLDGYNTDSNGLVLLGNAGVPGVDFVIPDGTVQNGADAVALYLDDATSFPNLTAVTGTNLVDALVYGTSDPDDAGLLGGLGESVQYDENANTASATESIQRKMDGTYEVKTPTPNASNDAAVCELSLTTTSATCDAFTVGTDTYTATVNFVGGGTSTYTVMADSGVVDLSGGDPDVDATGTITVTGVSEGTDVTITVTGGGGLCNLMSTVTSPTCEPSLTLPLYDDFDYPDGSLVGNGGWANFSGTLGDLLVSSGKAVVQHGTPSEDAHLEFTPVSGNVYFRIDFSVINPGSPISGTDNEYFAFFSDGGTFNFVARLDIVPPSGGGDFSVGLATNNGTAEAIWATDFNYGVTYQAIVRYNQDTNQAELWIDASSSGDTSILGTDLVDPGLAVSAFNLRQSDSDLNEGILVDNLVVSETFNEALSTSTFNTNTFKVFPNPTSLGYVNISSKSQTAMKVGVYDILGKQVINTTVANNRLDVSTLTTGIYVMKISQDNATTTKKLVVK